MISKKYKLLLLVHGFLFVSFLLFPFVLFFRCSHSCLHVCLSPGTLSGSHVLVLVLVFVTSRFILVVPRSWCFPLPNYLVCLYCLPLFFVVSLAVCFPLTFCVIYVLYFSWYFVLCFSLITILVYFLVFLRPTSGSSCAGHSIPDRTCCYIS